jgi:hypothetical protein
MWMRPWLVDREAIYPCACEALLTKGWRWRVMEGFAAAACPAMQAGGHGHGINKDISHGRETARVPLLYVALVMALSI